MPNTRSDGARSTGAAIATVTIPARARTAATSAARPGNVDHRGDDQHGPGNCPGPDVGDARREAGVAGEALQREQPCRLRELEDREAGEETPPAGRDERGDPEREIEADLEGRKERDRPLWIVERRTTRKRDDACVERAEEMDEHDAHDEAG